MTHLNSNIMINKNPTLFISSIKKFSNKEPFHYNSSTTIEINDDAIRSENDELGSPISNNSSWDSRRSSFSSVSSNSAASSPRLGFKNDSFDKHRPVSVHRLGKSPSSIKAAYERIECLENCIQEQQQQEYKLSQHKKEQKEQMEVETSKNDARGDVLRIEDYQSVFKNMSQQIDQFFKTRNTSIDNSIEEEQHNQFVLFKLNQLKELIYQTNQGSQNSIPDPVSSIELLDFIQDWIIQEHNPNQVSENVANYKSKNERLIRALQRLGATHTTLKKQVRKIPKFEKKINQLTITIQKQQQRQQPPLKNSQNNLLKEENTELELLVDNLRREMEVMLDELEQTKQDRDLYARKANTLEKDIQLIVKQNLDKQDIMAMQSQLNVYQKQVCELEQSHQEEQMYIEKLRNENRQLTDSLYALKRDMARTTSKHQSEMAVLTFKKMGLLKKIDGFEKKLAVAAATTEATSKAAISVSSHKDSNKPEKEEIKNSKEVRKQPQQQQKMNDNTDLEIALRRTVAERDGQLAKLNVLLEKKQREIEQICANQEKKIKLEVTIHEQEIKQQMEKHYTKIAHTFQLNQTRESRALSDQIIDLETELSSTQYQLQTQSDQLLKLKHKHFESQEKIKQRVIQWENKESKLKNAIRTLEQKAITMEQETLHLYSRNLKLAHQLGDLDL